MSRRTATITGAAALAALAAAAVVASAATVITYEGRGVDDPAAKIELRVKKVDGKRFVTRIVADGLRHEMNAFCSGSGRIGLQPMRGRWRVREDNSFRAVGQTNPPDPAYSGELRVRGEIFRRRARGTMRFTFGKDGCKTVPTEWRARR